MHVINILRSPVFLNIGRMLEDLVPRYDIFYQHLRLYTVNKGVNNYLSQKRNKLRLPSKTGILDEFLGCNLF